jgi:hypothetical protein
MQGPFRENSKDKGMKRRPKARTSLGDTRGLALSLQYATTTYLAQSDMWQTRPADYFRVPHWRCKHITSAVQTLPLKPCVAVAAN